MSFVRRPSPSLSAEVKTVPTSQQNGSLKVKLIRVFVLSDMLLYTSTLSLSLCVCVCVRVCGSVVRGTVTPPSHQTVIRFAKSLGNGTYRYKFSIPLGGAVVTEMQGLDNTLLIKAKGGADRFFLFKDAAERRKWTATLWPMILVLSADGRVKPDVRLNIPPSAH